MKQLILGGVRSGKSRLAEQLAKDSALDVVYIATATAGDDEMRARIKQHQQQRPAHWQVVEEPVRLAKVLQQYASSERCLLVDCLTLWLTNLLISDQVGLFEQERKLLLDTLPRLAGHIILVSNETNMGIVPQGVLSRQFCDQAGWLHQDLAKACDRVILTIAGLPQVLKGDAL